MNQQLQKSRNELAEAYDVQPLWGKMKRSECYRRGYDAGYQALISSVKKLQLADQSIRQHEIAGSAYFGLIKQYQREIEAFLALL